MQGARARERLPVVVASGMGAGQQKQASDDADACCDVTAPAGVVTPGYSGHWPGYSGRGVSISIIRSSGPHNHLNRKYHTLSLPHSHSLPLPLSLISLTSSPSPLSSRFRNLSFQLDSKAKGASLGVGDHLLQVFHIGATSFSSFLARGTSSRY